MATRGRPTIQPSAEQRRQVKALQAKKMPIKDIALIMKMAEKTLRKHFAVELFLDGRKPEAGLPPVKITKALRQRVIRLVACNFPEVDVARAIDWTLPQLREHLAEELATGHAKYRAEIIDDLHEQMKAGKTGATNALEKITALKAPSAPAAAPKEKPLGKKEQADLEALEVPEESGWGDLVRH